MDINFYTIVSYMHILLSLLNVFAGQVMAQEPTIQTSLPFAVPSLGDILTFGIRAFFVIAGLAALFYLLIGAFSWITSGGAKDAVEAAQKKIQAAIVGLILIVAVLAIIVTMEQVVFKKAICVGLTCPVTVPGLLGNTCTIPGTKWVPTNPGDQNAGGMCQCIGGANENKFAPNELPANTKPEQVCPPR